MSGNDGPQIQETQGDLASVEVTHWDGNYPTLTITVRALGNERICIDAVEADGDGREVELRIAGRWS